MAIEAGHKEIQKDHQDTETELKYSLKKVNTTSEEPSPKGVLDAHVSDACSVSETSRCSSERENSEKGGGIAAAAAAAVAAFNPMNYGPPMKDFIGSVKKKSGVHKLSSSTISMFTGYELSAKSTRQKMARMSSADDDIDCGLLTKQLKNFAYSELAAATNDFSPDRLLGQGGNADVYKGCLPDGTLVAVKKLTKNSDKKEESTVDFLSELGIIAHVEHPNATKIFGFGIENGLYIVLQFSPHGSVESHLQGSAGLEWKTRFKVALGVADGLSYLHHTCKRRIIHRDIKSSNILLAENYEPLISDFGLAKWLPDNWLNHVVYPIEGTLGYLAPEYFMHGIADEKTDVFAYGVVLLEIITGRHAVEVDSKPSLVMWAKPFLEKNNVKELVDPRLGDNYDPAEMRRVMVAAHMCIHHLPENRPYMNKVVEVLRGEAGPLETMKQISMSPKKLVLDHDYSTSSYFRDLNRHRELVLE